VTLRHGYGKKNANENTQTFTYIVTVTAPVTGETELAENAAINDEPFTVRVRGNQTALSGLHLRVDPIGDGLGEYLDAVYEDVEEAEGKEIDQYAFLRLYHIYVTDDEDNEVDLSGQNVNLQVTITYDETPEGWPEELYVGHYAMSGGAVVRKAVEDETGIKKVKVSGSSVTFHITDFSVITLSAPNPTYSSGTPITVDDGSIMETKTIDDANEWQIVDQKYIGNDSVSYKQVKDSVRYQKNVIPTEKENEFWVYLSVDYRQLFAEYFATASYGATTSHNYHDSTLFGTVVEGATGNEGVGVSGTQGATLHITDKHGNPITVTANNGPCYFTIVSSDYKLIAENVPLYWSQAQNVTIYLEINSVSPKKWIILGQSVKANGHQYLMLSQEAEQLIMSEALQKASLDYLTDTMGDYIEFLGMSTVEGDLDRSDTANNYYDEGTATLHWKPVLKENPTIDKVETGEEVTVSFYDHNNGDQLRTMTVKKTVSWAMNVAELLYKVRLDVEKAGFDSCADNMNSAVSDPESYPVNDSAVLHYFDADSGSRTASFPVPHVRGLLYDLKLKKVDQAGAPLGGAAFTLTGRGNDKTDYTLTAVSDETTGEIVFENLPWGDYTVSETKAPHGYTIPLPRSRRRTPIPPSPRRPMTKASSWARSSTTPSPAASPTPTALIRIPMRSATICPLA